MLLKPMENQHFGVLGRLGPSSVVLGRLEGVLGASSGHLGGVLEVLVVLGRQHF